MKMNFLSLMSLAGRGPMVEAPHRAEERGSAAELGIFRARDVRAGLNAEAQGRRPTSPVPRAHDLPVRASRGRLKLEGQSQPGGCCSTRVYAHKTAGEAKRASFFSLSPLYQGGNSCAARRTTSADDSASMHSLWFLREKFARETRCARGKEAVRPRPIVSGGRPSGNRNLHNANGLGREGITMAEGATVRKGGGEGRRKGKSGGRW
jgi:hypothetical protein